MAKNSAKPHRRAYINPLPDFPEAAQRAAIEQQFNDIAEWYVESNKITRADFIQHLRNGDEAIVARAGCFAKSRGTNDSRLSDMAEARGDVHARCAVLVAADNKQRNSRDHWQAMKAAAKVDLNAFKNMNNGSARKHNLTDAQVRRVMQVRDSKRYTNDAQRLAALKKEGIEIGRTYMVMDVPRIARERGLDS